DSSTVGAPAYAPVGPSFHVIGGHQRQSSWAGGLGTQHAAWAPIGSGNVGPGPGSVGPVLPSMRAPQLGIIISPPPHDTGFSSSGSIVSSSPPASDAADPPDSATRK